MKNLKLEKPIAFIDVETTGLSVTSDRIVELTVLKVQPDGNEELKSARLNPGIAIPAAATRIHGITDADVAEKPRFRQYAVGLRQFLEDCDFGGFGVTRFDLPILEAEFKRAGVEFSASGRRVLDAQIIYHIREPRDLAAAYFQYCGKQLENLHTSKGDVQAALEVLECQLDHYSDLPNDVDGLFEFCNPDMANWIDSEGKFIWLEHEAHFTFGQHRDKSLKEVAMMDPEYLKWITDADFSDEVKKIVVEAMKGNFPKRSIP